ncbi:uncharacterized protein BKCO1_8500020 [Diplodia corticola]|uniref:Uncharacterized protein n=1 Tax=Diplodia corticola TaxID=236234 RepID=A0A1J9RMZ3_9PEZI|nr:uncharacterized protein BKCO1_8500020 [Diplodia corticola]OJD29292.1 hypothetical protein BKCO1_8500020 [Diplodia corticola]
MADFISRSLTTRRAKKPEKVSTGPARAFSMKKASNPAINRVQISGPLNLISTTNMLSYNAPDIAGTRQVSSESHSTSHSEESDRSSTSSGSRGVSTDASSLESLPTSPETNHLTGFFDSAQKAAPERSRTPRSASNSVSHSKSSSRPSVDQSYRSLESKRSLDSKRSFDAGPAKRTLETKRSIDSIRAAQEASRRAQESIPDIPQRARSHSKEAHEVLARKRSIRGMGPPSSLHGRSSSLQEQRASVDMFSSTAGTESNHPFGRELEQLNEVAEELGGVIRDVEMDEDARYMVERGLQKFCASDYLAEIAPFMTATYARRPMAPTPTLSTTWI